MSDRLFFEIQKASNCLNYQKISPDYLILDFLSFKSFTPVINDQERQLFVKLKDSAKLRVKRDFFDRLVHALNNPSD